MRHQVGEPVGARVELLLDRLLAPPLAVLEESHEQERDDRRHRVDDQLPGVDVVEDEEARQPEQDEQHARHEEERAPDEIGRATREAVERRASIAACGVAAGIRSAESLEHRVLNAQGGASGTRVGYPERSRSLPPRTTKTSRTATSVAVNGVASG